MLRNSFPRGLKKLGEWSVYTDLSGASPVSV